ncbi:unnamed protein product [Coffea canephora]|uniref:C2 domain-containing protein n=1 Tax=Coffea canephora TaxID=49390 RepID=A0A068UNC1_COFCA|nr:unnamed protein product [Coffea canephora]
MNQRSMLEITVISAQGLKASSSSTLFPPRRLRPFATITTTPPFSFRPPAAAANMSCKKLSTVCRTKVDDKGGVNPTWGEKFQLPLDAHFSCMCLQLYTKKKNFFFTGYTHLGWCQIPVTDILDGLLPAGSLRHLAYQLRARDGSRGHGIVNVAVKLESTVPLPMAHPQWSSTCSNTQYWPEMNASRMVVGIPVECVSSSTPDRLTEP